MNLTGVGYFIGIGPEKAFSYQEIVLEVTFSTTLQNRKPQMPSSAVSSDS